MLLLINISIQPLPNQPILSFQNVICFSHSKYRFSYMNCLLQVYIVTSNNIYKKCSVMNYTGYLIYSSAPGWKKAYKNILGRFLFIREQVEWF